MVVGRDVLSSKKNLNENFAQNIFLAQRVRKKKIWTDELQNNIVNAHSLIYIEIYYDMYPTCLNFMGNISFLNPDHEKKKVSW